MNACVRMRARARMGVSMSILTEEPTKVAPRKEMKNLAAMSSLYVLIIASQYRDQTENTMMMSWKLIQEPCVSKG